MKTANRIFSRSGKTRFVLIWAALVFIEIFPVIISAQTTEFTFQGRLNNNNSAATGNFDMQFRLWDDPDAGEGTQQGATITKTGVAVSNGIFTVLLDFGSTVFATNADRFLEISIRPAGSTGGYTSLAPRQKLTSTPYAVRSLTTENALNLGGVAANQFVQTNDARLTDARNPLPGSGNYVQNTTTQQAAANFNISGTGTANIFNAATQFNIGGSRVLAVTGGGSNANSNTFTGIGAGASTTPSTSSFFPGNLNSFFGFNAGQANTTGSSNSFFGESAGLNNTFGGSNSFVGRFAGYNNTAGSSNSFFGNGAGYSNTTGESNTLIGASANVFAPNLTHATAIGAGATVATSHSVVLGFTENFGGNHLNLTKVGIGTNAPAARLHIRANTGNIVMGASDCGNQWNAIGFGSTLTCANYSLLGDGATTLINRPTGGSIHFREANFDQMVINPGGVVTLLNLGTASSPQATLCRNTSSQIAFCSSSSRYKTNIEPYKDGLNLINQLNPVSFDWKTNNLRDIGLIAEDVAEIEPRLTYKNHNGEIEGVSYSQIGVVLINAVKEQQSQIERLQEQNKQLSEQNKQMQQQINQLKKLVCQSNTQTEICKK
ncbi:MAG: tail fiber domain-containing protein [Acidobacteriota bacterium]|nr:tail fiber domain-containing protein [Acidobacteriota bacterium]